MNTDVAVIGAGLMGSATAYALARRGRSVMLFEQFDFGHSQGSSHGSARIYRRAYPDLFYARLTGRANELWRELELASGRTLLNPVGGLDHGAAREPERIAATLAELGVAHSLLTGAEAAERWPGMRFDGPVVFHPDAGAVDAASAVESFLDVGARNGAVVRPRTPVLGIVAEGEGVRLTGEFGEVTAGVAVVAAGAWLEPLLGTAVKLPELKVSQQQVFHFPRRDLGLEWPVTIHVDPLNVYHLPGGRDGGQLGGRKLAEHDGGHPVTAADRDGVVDPAARARAVAYVEEWLPGLVPEPFNETTCLYTTTPSEDFLLDRVGPLVVCSPCSGHGAKFAPLVGELTADLATGEGERLERFSL
jgi:monomeric sarcosine oxidase